MCVGPVEGYALWLECVEVVKDGLEEGEFGRKFGEFGGDAVYDVSDGSTVRIDRWCHSVVVVGAIVGGPGQL